MCRPVGIGFSVKGSFPSDLSSIFPTDSQVVAWGPSKMSVWFGEAILSGDLEVSLPHEHGLKMNSETSPPENERSEIRLVEAVINLDSWLLQKKILKMPLHLQYFWKVRYGRLRGKLFRPKETQKEIHG